MPISSCPLRNVWTLTLFKNKINHHIWSLTSIFMLWNLLFVFCIWSVLLSYCIIGFLSQILKVFNQHYCITVCEQNLNVCASSLFLNPTSFFLCDFPPLLPAFFWSRIMYRTYRMWVPPPILWMQSTAQHSSNSWTRVGCDTFSLGSKAYCSVTCCHFSMVHSSSCRVIFCLPVSAFTSENLLSHQSANPVQAKPLPTVGQKSI